MFRYLRDPVFLAAFGLYLLNRLVLKRLFVGGFFRDHANDVLCIPVCLPPLLWAMRRLGLRQNDLPPSPLEIAGPVIVWSIMFEIMLPGVELFGRFAPGDPGDVLSYCVGALVAAEAWRRLYPEQSEPDADQPKSGLQL
jgi:hypothetical protein